MEISPHFIGKEEQPGKFYTSTHFSNKKYNFHIFYTHTNTRRNFTLLILVNPYTLIEYHINFALINCFLQFFCCSLLTILDGVASAVAGKQLLHSFLHYRKRIPFYCFLSKLSILFSKIICPSIVVEKD